jgi:phage shock protein A
MFPFDVFFKKREDDRVKQLERRVEDLEKALVDLSSNFRKLASLSLKTGEELENLANYIKRNEKNASIHVPSIKKSDDFYN